MRVVIIDEAVTAAAEKCRAYAESNKYNLHDLHNMLAHPEKVPGADLNREVMIPGGVRVVYSIEQHPPGWCHHFSFSLDTPDPNMTVHPVVVDQILPLFGVKRSCTSPDGYWMEDGNIVNLLFLL